VISQPLDSEMLSWLGIPATQPHGPTHGHTGTHHTAITVGKKRGIEGGRQKNKKNAAWYSPKIAPNGHYTETT